MCQEDGLCHVCGKAIVWGTDAVYSIRGSHYDCEFPNGRNEPSVTMAELMKDLGIGPTKYDHLTATPALARANGGHLHHWVVPNQNRSLCGHKPVDKAKHMRQRGMWLFIKDGADVTGFKFCQKCLDKHAELYPSED